MNTASQNTASQNTALNYRIRQHIKNRTKFKYAGWDLPLLKGSKWKPHKALIIVRIEGTWVRVARLDNKGMDSAGSRTLTLRYTSLVPVKDEDMAKPKSKPVSIAAALAPCAIQPQAIVAKQPLTTGVKYDQDKPEFSLLPKKVLQPIMRVLSFGAKKYTKDNWQRVDNAQERYFNAMQRHLMAWWEGEKKDPETGESHLAHAGCCLLFLLWFETKEGEV